MLKIFTYRSNIKKILYRNLIGSSTSSNDILKEKLCEIVPETREKVKKFITTNGDKIIDKITVSQVMSGMRDIKSMYHEPSLLDSEEGIRFRGLSCSEVDMTLPKLNNNKSVSPESIFWFLLTGQVPTPQEVVWLSNEWCKRSEVPYYLINLINNFPDDLHPMAQLSAAVTLLGRFSKFSMAYNSGNIHKTELWKYMYEDCMNLIAKLPSIAAIIYRNSYHDGSMLPYDQSMDWTQNYVNMLNINRSEEFYDLMRLYLWMHSDHEGGNVSTHTAHLVGSGLADVYLSFAASLNGLAGPLHGRANQEVVEWLSKLKDSCGSNPSSDRITKYCEDWLKVGVIPGFGHAVLRKTDPRCQMFFEFIEKNDVSGDDIEILKKLNVIVTPMLQKLGKVKNPYPNVDFASGTIFKHFKLVESEYYTVPFGLSRSLGVCCALIWDRILCLPLERPKSLDLKQLQKLVDLSNK